MEQDPELVVENIIYHYIGKRPPYTLNSVKLRWEFKLDLQAVSQIHPEIDPKSLIIRKQLDKGLIFIFHKLSSRELVCLPHEWIY